jgi:hypothetical protein
VLYSAAGNAAAPKDLREHEVCSYRAALIDGLIYEGIISPRNPDAMMVAAEPRATTTNPFWLLKRETGAF